MLDGELVIENMEFNMDLYNSSSPYYQKLAQSMEEQVSYERYIFSRLNHETEEYSVQLFNEISLSL